MTAPLRIAVLTCGAIVTKTHLPGFAALGRDVVDVVAFQSRTRSSAEASCAQWGTGAVVDDWRSVLERDDVDAVDICSPNALHAEVAIAAAAAGKHVLVEKPMATTVADADAMIAAARAAGVVLMAAHNLRYAPPYLAAARAVRDDGLVGSVVGVRVAMGHGGPETWTREAGWFRDPRLAGGGALLDLGIHVADLLRAVTGDEVESVAAVVRRPAPDAVEESGSVALSLRGGGIGTLSASWSVRPGPDHHLVVQGTEGTLSIERGAAVVRPASADGGGGGKVVVDPPSPVPDVLGDFVAACRGEREPAVRDVDGRQALAIIEAAYRSASSGAAVVVG